MFSDLTTNPLIFILSVAAFIMSVIIHEVSHGFIADRLGDPTARISGRLTLNPIPHIDPIGSILVPLFLLITHSPFLIGWAKPVPIDVFNLKNPRRDSAIISLAGPFSNLLIAVFSSILLRILLVYHLQLLTINFVNITAAFLTLLLPTVIILNIFLAIFNLVPVHPLDGFKIVEGFLPEDMARQWAELEPYGMIFLLFLVLPIFSGTAPIFNLISPVINFILGILLPGTPVI